MSDETEVIHELIKPFLYTPKNSGEETEAQFITLKEPSVKQLTACSTLKQAFVRVIAAEQGKEEVAHAPTDAEKGAMEDDIINALYASGEDISKLFLTAKELFRDVALVDGEKKITVPMLDAMCIADIEKMTGKYMANFILASVLEGQ